jgi:hypothetical protein
VSTVVGRSIESGDAHLVNPISGPLERVLQEAERATGLSDFGPHDFLEPLRVYLDLQQDAPLSPEGRLQQAQLVQRCLENRQRFARDLA